VKGGQLARAIYPATTISLILSDVIGDPIDIIASGPTCSDNSSFSDALAVIRKYKLMKSMPSTLIKHIKSGVSGLIPETPKSGDLAFSNVCNIIIGNNKIALKAAQSKAIEYGYSSYIIADGLEGKFYPCSRTNIRCNKRQSELFSGIKTYLSAFWWRAYSKSYRSRTWGEESTFSIVFGNSIKA